MAAMSVTVLCASFIKIIILIFLELSQFLNYSFASNQKMTGKTGIGDNASDDLCAEAVDGTAKDYFHMNSNFGGIPEVLVIDLLTFLGLLVLFFIIRKGGYKILTGNLCKNRREAKGGDTESPKDLHPEDKPVLERFLGCLGYSEEKMLTTAGYDAVQYLRFQVYLIGFLAMVSLLSIGVILPIDLQGHNHRNASSPSAPYAQTVFDNLDSR